MTCHCDVILAEEVKPGTRAVIIVAVIGCVPYRQAFLVIEVMIASHVVLVDVLDTRLHSRPIVPDRAAGIGGWILFCVEQRVRVNSGNGNNVPGEGLVVVERVGDAFAERAEVAGAEWRL